MSEDILALPWGTRKRLHYLEFKLFWDGRVNRGDLTTTFGISIPQASADIARYQELAPGNIVYNPSAKYYLPTEEFSSILIKISANAYFSEIVSSSNAENSPLIIDDYVAFVPNPNRVVDVSILRTIVQSIKNRRKIIVDYRSFKSPQAGSRRLITPHAFGYDGFRWHVRAYCHKDNIFKDYVLGRIISAEDFSETDIDYKLDHKWFQFIDVVIGPSQKQSKDQRSLIEIDYGMTDHKLTISCRVSLLWYLLKKLGIDSQNDQRAGEVQQIALINKDEIFDAMNL